MSVLVTVIAGGNTYRFAGQTTESGGYAYLGRLLSEPTWKRKGANSDAGAEIRETVVELRNSDQLIPCLALVNPVDLWNASVFLAVTGASETWAARVRAWMQNPKTGVLSMTVSEDCLPVLKRFLPDEAIRLTDWPDASGDSVLQAIPIPFGGTTADPIPIRAILADRTNFRYLISVGELQGYVKVTKDTAVITTGFTVSLGSPTAPTLSGYAYIEFAADPRDDNGRWPEIVVEVVGMKLGSFTEDQCRNPARVMQYLLTTANTGAGGWGLGIASGDLDSASFAQAIIDCDAAGLKLDGVLSERKQAAYWTYQIELACRGRLRFIGGKWHFSIDKIGTSVKTYTVENADIAVVGKGDLSERKNKITVQYRYDLPKNKWIGSTYTEDAASIAQIGRNEKTVQLLLSRDHASAAVIRDYHKNAEKYGETKIEGSTRDFISVEDNSVVTIDMPTIGIASSLFRITSLVCDDFKATFKARSYSDSYFAVGAGETYSDPDTEPEIPGATAIPPAKASDITLASTAWVQVDGTLAAQITGTFTAGARTQYVEVAYAEGLTPDPEDYRLVNLSSPTGFSISGLKPGVAHTVRITGYNAGGAGTAATATHTTSTKDTPPAAVTGLAVAPDAQNKAILNFSWNRVNEPDIRGYLFRNGGTSWATATPVFGGTPETVITENKASVTLTASGSTVWRVAAIDRAGNISAESTLTYDALVEPAPVTGLTAVQDPANPTILNVSWTPSAEKDIKRYEVRTGGTNWATATIPAGGDKIANPYTTITLATEGPLTIRVKTINRAGFYSVNEAIYIANIDLTPSDVTGFQALQNGDNILLSWTKVTDQDLLGYRVVEGPAYSLGALFAEADPSKSQIEIPVSSEHDYVLHIKAVNRSGHESAIAGKSTVTIANLTPRNVVQSFDELVLQSGTHSHTAFGASQYTMANLGGRMSDYPTLRMDAAGSANVLKLAAGQTSGTYTCVQKDMGEIITAHISVDWFVLALYGSGQAARLEFRTSLNGSTWADWLTFAPATQTFRYVAFRAVLTTTDVSKTPEVTLFTISIDVPDTELIFKDHAIAAAGTELNFGHTFHVLPSVTVTSLGDNTHGVLVSKTTEKCTLKIRNFVTGAYVSGTADIRVRGY